jgi:hypothetical protein
LPLTVKLSETGPGPETTGAASAATAALNSPSSTALLAATPAQPTNDLRDIEGAPELSVMNCSIAEKRSVQPTSPNTMRVELKFPCGLDPDQVANPDLDQGIRCWIGRF